MHKENIIAFNPEDKDSNLLDVISYYVGEIFVNLFYDMVINSGFLWQFIDATGIPLEYFHAEPDKNQYKFLSYSDILRLKKKSTEKDREYIRNNSAEFREDIDRIYSRYHWYLENRQDEELQIFIIVSFENRYYLLYNDSVVNFQIQCEDELNIFNQQLAENPATEEMIAAAYFINSEASITDILVELCRSIVQLYFDIDKVPDEKKDEYWLFFMDNGKTFMDFSNRIINSIIIICGNVINALRTHLIDGIHVSNQYTTPLFKYIRQKNIDVRVTCSDSISILDHTGNAMTSTLSLTVECNTIPN